jgi:hypothetical protein
MIPHIDRLFNRHVHLDFHTSEHIDNIGGAFTMESFQAALKAAHLDAITIFAKCHHSWCYFPSAVGMPHPHLQTDLLGRQIEAAHAIGVKAPIYITVAWSANDAEMHPEWLQLQRDGSPLTTGYDLNATPDTPKPGFNWKFLCPSGEYRAHIEALTREIAERYPVDGIFFDICGQGPCFCPNCMAGMAERGLDPDNPADAQAYNVIRWTSFMAACNEILHAAHPQATVFYNGNAGLGTPPAIWEHLTHFELEDLPTTWGGYDKFPLRAKFFMKKGKPRLAMSGKFHTAWGEFGGFKHPDAILFEAAGMISFGASCSFGDQVHPDGLMEMATYENIGEAYEYTRKIEEYGLGDAHSFSNLGLWLCGDEAHDQGVANMLLETQTDFDVVDATTDLSAFATVIVPGGRCLDAAAAAKLSAFAADGGGLLLLGESILDATGNQLPIDIGAAYAGPGEYDCDYTVAGGALACDLPEAAFLNYETALRTTVADAEVLATIREPYFSRTYGHYCSHQNTANRREVAAHPAAIRKGNVVYLAHPLGRLYYAHGARVHRQLFVNALDLVHQSPVLRVAMPSAGRVNLLHQPAKNRYVLHLLYGPPLKRGRCEVIEDLVPLLDIPVELRVPEALRHVYLAPQGEDVNVISESGVTRLCVPYVQCHQAVVFEY